MAVSCDSSEQGSADKGSVAHNRCGHDESPEASHGIESDGLQHSHVVFRVLRLDGIRLVCRGRRLLVKIGGVVEVGMMRLDLGEVAGRLGIADVAHSVDDLGDRRSWPD